MGDCARPPRVGPILCAVVLGIAKAAPDISFDAMSGRINALADIAMRDPAVDTVDYWIGANPAVSQGQRGS